MMSLVWIQLPEMNGNTWEYTFCKTMLQLLLLLSTRKIMLLLKLLLLLSKCKIMLPAKLLLLLCKCKIMLLLKLLLLMSKYKITLLLKLLLSLSKHLYHLQQLCSCTIHLNIQSHPRSAHQRSTGEMSRVLAGYYPKQTLYSCQVNLMPVLI